MRSKKNQNPIIRLYLNLIILFNAFNTYYLAQTKQNSIIKLFCLQSVKEEMMKAEMVYSEEIAVSYTHLTLPTKAHV